MHARIAAAHPAPQNVDEMPMQGGSPQAAAQDVRPLLASRYLPALPVLVPHYMRRASSAFLIASKSAFLALLFPPAKGFACNRPIAANVTASF